jgi:hypothetical protein
VSHAQLGRAQEKAQQLLDFLHSGSLTPEWAAIVAFYAALHLVERLCACESLHIDKHHVFPG